MRRWFKLGIADNDTYYDAGWGDWSSSIAVSMPHKDTLIAALNDGVGLQAFIIWRDDGSGADPARCTGETQNGDDFHLYQPYDVTPIVQSAGEIRGWFFGGIPGSVTQTAIFMTGDPPLYPDGRESPN